MTGFYRSDDPKKANNLRSATATGGFARGLCASGCMWTGLVQASTLVMVVLQVASS